MKFSKIKSKSLFIQNNLFEIILVLICFLAIVAIFTTLEFFKNYESKNGLYILVSGNEFPSISHKRNPAAYPFFTENDTLNIKNEISEVFQAEFFNEREEQIVYSNSDTYKVSGITYAYPSIKNFLNLNIIQGNFYTNNDLNSIVISDLLASFIFKSVDVVGKKIYLTSQITENLREVYKIIGVYKNFSKNDYIKSFQAFLYPKMDVPSIKMKTPTLFIRSKSGKFTSSQSSIINYINSIYKNNNYFKANGSSTYISTTGEFGTLAKPKIQLTFDKIVVSSFSAILLTVCLICIFTTFFLKSMLDTKRVGLLRVFGFTKLKIFQIYILKTLQVSLIGIFLGFLIFYFIIFIFKINFENNFGYIYTIIGCSGISILLLTLLISLYPIINVVRLNPIQALRES